MHWMSYAQALGRDQRVVRRAIAITSVALLIPRRAFAQGSPWENAVNVLMQAFTSTIARGLSLVAIVLAGLTFAFGEGGSKRVLAGVRRSVEQFAELLGEPA